jgi:hypothetical protein
LLATRTNHGTPERIRAKYFRIYHSFYLAFVMLKNVGRKRRAELP